MSLQINNAADLNARQQQAVEAIAYYLADERHQKAGGHDVLVTISVEKSDYGHVWVKVERDMPTLGWGNYLRFLESQDGWLILVGPRGAKTAKMYPKSVAQFKGKQYLGINIG